MLVSSPRYSRSRYQPFDVVGCGNCAGLREEIDRRFNAPERSLLEQGQEIDQQFSWLVAVFIGNIISILPRFLRLG